MTDIIVNEIELTFNRLEKEIYAAACEMACKALAYILEEIDKKLAQERDKTRYRHKGQRQTTIKTLMGEVSFGRTVYEHIDDEGRKTFVYLLDHELGFDTIGLISTNLAEKVVENVSISSFRNTAKNITDLTGQSIYIFLKIIQESINGVIIQYPICPMENGKAFLPKRIIMK